MIQPIIKGIILDGGLIINEKTNCRSWHASA